MKIKSLLLAILLISYPSDEEIDYENRINYLEQEAEYYEDLAFAAQMQHHYYGKKH